MSPTFSRGKGGRLYRYYVSASLQQGRKAEDDAVRRLPAAVFESLVCELIVRWIPSTETPFHLALAVRLRDRELLIDLPGNLAREVAERLGADERIIDVSKEACRIGVRLIFPLRGGKRRITAGTCSSKPDPSLITALRKAHGMISLRRGLPLVEAAPVSRYNRDLLLLAFLAPDLQRDILAGRQPPMLSLEKLRHTCIPLCWKQQRQVLGWGDGA